MSERIHRIHAGCNCYLIRGAEGCVLIDTGVSTRRRRLLRELERAGCRADDLRLVVLTHGDADHVGNAAALQDAFGAPIASHELEARMLETGDARANRQVKADRLPWVLRLLMPIGRLLGEAKPVKPNVLLSDGDDLHAYGVDARVVHLPGHSRGSIGVLTGDGDLFCGDLLNGWRRPSLHFFIDDLPTARASIEKIRTLPVGRIHPGHGRSFTFEQLPRS